MMIRQNALWRVWVIPKRVFSADLGIGDIGDITKVNYTEEFD